MRLFRDGVPERLEPSKILRSSLPSLLSSSFIVSPFQLGDGQLVYIHAGVK